MLKIAIYVLSFGDYLFKISDEEGIEIFISERYSSEEACLTAIERARQHAHLPQHYATRLSFDLKYFFYFTTPTHLIIGASEMWEEADKRDKYMKIMMEGFKNAEVQEGVVNY
ncbi:DUF1508 domain-containing protein [Gynurincola endophyticus]|uniref:DUF1508 domain-containing protein n=1 Tax=Gynurincola endophyticus TaxID=2479004 RepID=UPI0013156987|nr:DUF1508 domain-containing protein [Gynurincola endophyticus]